eukprot:1147319-Pelagomonas_calceolata.AAC.2
MFVSEEAGTVIEPGARGECKRQPTAIKNENHIRASHCEGQDSFAFPHDGLASSSRPQHDAFWKQIEKQAGGAKTPQILRAGLEASKGWKFVSNTYRSFLIFYEFNEKLLRKAASSSQAHNACSQSISAVKTLSCMQSAKELVSLPHLFVFPTSLHLASGFILRPEGHLLLSPCCCLSFPLPGNLLSSLCNAIFLTHLTMPPQLNQSCLTYPSVFKRLLSLLLFLVLLHGLLRLIQRGPLQGLCLLRGHMQPLLLTMLSAWVWWRRVECCEGKEGGRIGQYCKGEGVGSVRG